MHFRSVYDGACVSAGSIWFLYNLLKERDEITSISHKIMPSMREHIAFIQSNPYKIWNLIIDDEGNSVGSIYLSRQNEIGIFISRKHRGSGYGRQAVRLLIENNDGPFLANINPRNERSIEMFASLGFTLIQQTYKLDQ